MPLLELQRDPTPRQLRQFAASLAVLAVAAACWREMWIWQAVVVSLGVVAVSWCWPRMVRPVFVAVSLVSFPIGLVLSELLLLAVFFLVFTPIGLLMRLAGRDPLTRQFDRQASSYWTAKRQPPDAASYFRQS